MKNVFAFGVDLQIEDWVKYLAVDTDGEIWGFDEKPTLDEDWMWSCYNQECDLFGKLDHRDVADNSLLIVSV